MSASESLVELALSAIYGRWPTLSRGHLNVGYAQTADSRGVPVRHRYKGTGTHTAPDSGWPRQPPTAARPASDWRPSRLVIKSLRTAKGYLRPTFLRAGAPFNRGSRSG